MNIRKQLTNKLGEFTASEKIIANYFLKEGEVMNAKGLSDRLAISSPTISRFVRKIGYRNYEIFINEYERELRLKSKKGNELDVYEGHLRMLEKNTEYYNERKIAKLLEKFDSRKIVIAAIENTALPCIDFAKRLNRYGINIRVAKTAEEIIIESTLLCKGDIFIAVSVSGINKPIQKVVEQLNSRGIYTYGVSSSEMNLVQECCDYSLIYLEEDSLLSQRYSYLYPLTILFDNVYIQFTKTISIVEEENRQKIVEQILEFN